MAKESNVDAENGQAIAADEFGCDQQRFAWLLAPIRDLAKNWIVDIADVLGRYIEELNGVTLGNDEKAMVTNFAEAAMLLQGSATVYSKKVELLHQLCFELVRLLALKNEKQSNDRSDKQRANVGDDENAAEPCSSSAPSDPDLLTSIDDIETKLEVDSFDTPIDAGDFLTVAARVRLVLAPMPMSLLPLEDYEKSDVNLVSVSGEVIGRRDDFKMNTLKIDPSTGMLLCQDKIIASVTNVCSTNATAANTNEAQMDVFEVMVTDEYRDAIIPQHSPAQPEEASRYYDDDVAETSLADATVAADFDPIANAAVTAVLQPPTEAAIAETTSATPVSTKRSAKDKRRTLLAEIERDPFREIDFNESDNQDFANVSLLMAKTYKQGSACKPPEIDLNSSIDKPNGDNVCKFGSKHAGAFDELDRQNYAKLGNLLSKTFELPNNTIFLDAFQRSIPAKLVRNKISSNRRRRSSIESEMRRLQNGLATNLDAVDAYDDSFDNQNFEECAETCLPKGSDVTQPEDIANGLLTCEDLLRTRQSDASKFAKMETTMNGMNRRVQQWQAKMDPILKVEEQRRRFDVHEYGQDLVSHFGKMGTLEYNFCAFASEMPRWEIARYFLSTLMLVNRGNVELLATEEHGVYNFSDSVNIRLLSEKLSCISMSDLRPDS